MKLPRKMDGIDWVSSFRLMTMSLKRARMGAAAPTRIWCSTSPRANSPIMTSTNGMPPSRLTLPNVNRAWLNPDAMPTVLISSPAAPS